MCLFTMIHFLQSSYGEFGISLEEMLKAGSPSTVQSISPVVQSCINNLPLRYPSLFAIYSGGVSFFERC